MEFKEWWEKESGWGGELLSEGYLAEAAWNAAIEAACDAILNTSSPGSHDDVERLRSEIP
jgi:hypothetical protein